MSDDLWVQDPETEHKRRAVWGLTVLGLLAAIIVALMVFLLGSGGDSNNGGLPDTNDVPVTSASNPAGPTSSPGSSSAPDSSSRSAPSSPSSRASQSTAATTSCSGGGSCVLEGDAGKVIEAINAFRTQNGQQAVPGTTTSAAQQCSLNNGSGSCPQSYFWEPVSPQDGKGVVDKLTSRGEGRSFLLDPSMKAVQIGWAFVGGQYSCTIVSVS